MSASRVLVLQGEWIVLLVMWCSVLCCLFSRVWPKAASDFQLGVSGNFPQYVSLGISASLFIPNNSVSVTNRNVFLYFETLSGVPQG
jgi:hypothetical protein